MVKIIQGAAFYLFVYLMLGLVNSALMFVGVKLLKLTPLVALGALLLLSVFVLFFGFKKSVELFLKKSFPDSKLALACAAQVIAFVVLATTVEELLSPLFKSQKLFQVTSVFVNFLTFFLTYWLTVKFLLLRGEDEA